MDIHGAGRLAHQGHPARIAAEPGDVGLHEGQGLDDVEQCEVARILFAVAVLELRLVQEPEDAQPVVERHHDGILAAGERRAVVDGIRRVAGDVAATVDEHDDRPGRGRRRGGRPDVERQAVLRPDGPAQRGPDAVVVAIVQAGPVQPTGLDAGGSEGRGRSGFGPGPRVARRTPSQVRDRRPGIGHALPAPGARRPAVVAADDRPRRRAALHGRRTALDRAATRQQREGHRQAGGCPPPPGPPPWRDRPGCLVVGSGIHGRRRYPARRVLDIQSS